MAQYLSRISGPMLDRIDLLIDVPAVTAVDLIRPAPSEPSAAVAQRVLAAREMQTARYTGLGLSGTLTNAAVTSSVLSEVVSLDPAGQKLLHDAANAMRLSARGYHRILRVARTLADLDLQHSVGRHHLAEALSYRARIDQPLAA
jgi:magnesium chelatase family protein